MVKHVEKIDPIRDIFYRPLERYEFILEVFFYISAGFSLLTPLIDKVDHPTAYNATQILFVLSVATVWALNTHINLSLLPRAQEKRYQDFLSHAYAVPLSSDQTTGYYNNDADRPASRIALQVLENSFYSSDTIIQMAKRERIKVVLYVILFVIVILNRGTDLGVVAIATQIVFSEQILSRWFRIEWLRTQFDKIYNELFRLFQARPALNRFEVLALEIMGRYEMVKSTGAITLSSDIFTKRREEQMKKWESVKSTLKL